MIIIFYWYIFLPFFIDFHSECKVHETSKVWYLYAFGIQSAYTKKFTTIFQNRYFFQSACIYFQREAGFSWVSGWGANPSAPAGSAIGKSCWLSCSQSRNNRSGLHHLTSQNLWLSNRCCNIAFVAFLTTSRGYIHDNTLSCITTIILFFARQYLYIAIWTSERNQAKNGLAIILVLCVGSASHLGSGRLLGRAPLGWLLLLCRRSGHMEESSSATMCSRVVVPWDTQWSSL